MKGIENITLPRVGELRMGETIIEKDCTGEGLPIYSADKSNRPWAYSTHFKRLNQYGTIVLGARGTIGYPRLPKEAVFGATQTTITLWPDSEKFVPEFVYYALQQLDFSLLGAQQAIPMLTVGNLEAVSIPRYPKPEQSKIAEVLSKVDQAIEQTESLIAKQQRIKTGLMQDLLTRGIDEHGNLRSEETHKFKDSPLGRIPVEWEVCSLDQLVDAIDPQPDHRTPPEVSVGVPYIGISDFRSNGEIDFDGARKISLAAYEKQKKSFRISEGDFVFGKIGTIGVPQKLPTYRDYALSANVILLKPKETPSYIYWWMESPIAERLVSLELHSTSQAAFGIQKIRTFPIPCPGKNEREHIGKLLNELKIQNQLQLVGCRKLRSLKTALMQDLLTGKKRVTPLLERMEVCL